MELRSPRATEQSALRSLLIAAALPVEDLDQAQVRFFVAIEDEEPVGVIGLEAFGTVGLLRSLAVRSDRRGAGIGGRLVEVLEAQAREAGFEQLVLLTMTAAPFFARRGYRAIDRAQAPAEVLGSAEFRSLCPASATCMTRSLVG